MLTRVHGAEVPVYPDDLLPQLQHTLALLADLDLWHENQHNHLDSWSGPTTVKERLRAELDQCHRANREQLEACLEALWRRAEGLQPATPRRTEH
jgi:hypothetical protein